MHARTHRWTEKPGLRLIAAVVVAIIAVTTATAQVASLYYQEVVKEGRVYVFNTPERFKAFSDSGEVGTNITLVGRGPDGETVVAENETALDLYLFRHNLPAYDRPTPKKDSPAAAAFPKTTIGGRVYADATAKENKDDGTGVKSADSGVGVDVKRFYFTVNHDFDSSWSAQFQSDIGDQGAKRYDVFVKKAFIQLKPDNAAIFRLGSADTPWVPWVEGIYGQRYLENAIIDGLSFGTSADWGLHFLGKAADGRLSYQLSVLNGRGYSNPSRSKSVDFEGRVSVVPVSGLTLAVGGYSGKRGQDTDAVPALHTATRIDGLAHLAIGSFRIGGEYFSADNWNQVTKVPEDKSNGYSGWVQYKVDPQWMLFGRYDNAKPSKDLNPNLKYTYYNAGVQWQVNKAAVATLAYKHGEGEGGTVGTSNGTIGSTKAGFKGTYNEIGLWFSYDF